MHMGHGQPGGGYGGPPQYPGMQPRMQGMPPGMGMGGPGPIKSSMSMNNMPWYYSRPAPYFKPGPARQMSYPPNGTQMDVSTFSVLFNSVQFSSVQSDPAMTAHGSLDKINKKSHS
jgi:hypothetical protein